MKYKQKSDAVLLLDDGTVFYGKSAAGVGTATGEICFNTGMTGYQEIFTDPSYYGQLMVTTNSHIGNYGVHPDEVESEGMKIAGLVTKDFSQRFSRPSGESSLEKYFDKENRIAISEIDTRAVVRHIRSKGAMNAIISSETTDIDTLKQKLSEVPSMEGLELSSKVSTKEPYFIGEENAEFKIAVLDVGVKKNILRCFAERGCYLKVFPMNTSLDEMKAWNPDGYFFSNGPGDPSAMENTIALVKETIETGMPTFGICLGHQLVALSQGVSTYKMHNGHRGINHPVKNLITGKGEITSQNHGFVVKREDVEQNDNIEITHVHLNDDTIAGIRLKNHNCFSVQFHPEASPGPHDSRYLFDQFIENIKTHKASL